MIKIFGVGNILFSDDGIGVKVTEYIKRKLEFDECNELVDKNKKIVSVKDMEFIIGETNLKYCLNNVDNDDFVIVIDGTSFDFKPGHVSKLSFEECDNFICDGKYDYSDNLIKILRKEHSNVKGYLIGIEIEKLDNSLELSPKLSKDFNNICDRVLNQVINLVKAQVKC